MHGCPPIDFITSRASTCLSRLSLEIFAPVTWQSQEGAVVRGPGVRVAPPEYSFEIALRLMKLLTFE